MRFLIKYLLFIFLVFPLCCEVELENLYPDEEIVNQPEIELELIELSENPVAINFENLDKLLIIPGITAEEINKLNMIIKNRVVENRTDLVKRGFPEEKLKILDEYIMYSHPPEGDLKIGFAGVYQDTVLTGSNLRGKLKYGDIRMGFLFDRDQKEKWGNVFYPLYIQYDSYPYKITTGYYSLRWGYGILHAAAYRIHFGKGAGGISRSQRELIKPYSSSCENQYMTGIGVSYDWRMFKIEGFFSDTSIGVHYNEDMKITSFSNEIGKDTATVQEKLCGMAIIWDNPCIKSGVIAELIRFSNGFEAHRGWQKFLGNSGWFEYYGSIIKGGGEIARADGKWGELLYVNIGNRRFEQNLLIRNYEEEFPDIHGNPVSRKSFIGGERGIYYGIRLKPVSKLEIKMYSDLYNFICSRYLIELPSGGSEQMVNLKYGDNKNYVQFYGKYRKSDKYVALEDSSKVTDCNTTQLQFTWNEKVSMLEFRTSIMWRYQDIPEVGIVKRGLALYQEVEYKLKKFRFYFRVSVFRTELPLYLYENNIRYSNKQVCFTDDGYRFSIKASQKWEEYQIEAKLFEEIKEGESKWGIYLGINYHLLIR